jgi:nitrogen-specific signal transduction histidine kinase
MSDPMHRRHARRLEALGYLTGGLSHDLNNLLMIVLGNAEMLEDMGLHEEVPERERLLKLSQTVLATTERAAFLTRQLAGFARRRSTEPQVTPVHPMLQALDELLRRALGSRVTLVCDLAAEHDSALVDLPQLEAAIVLLTLATRERATTAGQVSLSTRNLVVDEPAGSGLDESRNGLSFALTVAHHDGDHASEDMLEFAREIASEAGGALATGTGDGGGLAVTFLLPVVGKPADEAAAGGG